MFLGIAGILLVLWLIGFIAIPTLGFFIHILLILAIIAVVWHFISGRRRV